MLLNHAAVQMNDLSERFTLPDFTRQLSSIVALNRETLIRQSTLESLHTELIEPFLNGLAQAEGTDLIMAKVAAAGSIEAAIASRLLTYGYCSHYFTGQGTPDLPEEPDSPHFRQYTLVATCDSRQTPLLLGTLQASVGSTVPALALFEPGPGRRLPHHAFSDGQATTELIGELRRFSVNPLLEAVSFLPDDNLKAMLANYRSLIYRELYQLSLRLFAARNIQFVYGIATPEIYRFFTRSGMSMSLLEGMALAENDEVNRLRQEFALYWRPQAPLEQQPALYRIYLPAHGPFIG
jgi:hypothetical protein